MTCSEFGKNRRLGRLFFNNRMLVVPIDDSLIFGPYNGLYAISKTISEIELSKPTAILGFKGSLSQVQSNDMQLILNLTASTTIGNHVSKVVIGKVLDALRMDIDCIAAHINYTSEYENQMIEQFAAIASEADNYGLPTLAISYPRTRKNNTDYNYTDLDESTYTDLICHCTRTSVELGADIIKTQYTGSTDSFSKVVKSALGKPVIIAGGPIIDIREAYSMAKSVIDAGAAGISYGRNVFNQTNIFAFLSGIKEIVFFGNDVDSALEVYWRNQDV